ncbi:MAG: GNAT family N-acetyltransferase [Amaricoccus sp.]
MRHRAGDRVEVVITFLAMEGRPAYPRPHLPLGPVSALIAAERPPAWYFLDLYDAVGREYDWTDRREDPRDVLEAFLHDPAVTLYTFVRAGWPHGFFVLDAREPAVCNLAYFGLVPEAIGRGLGSFLLYTAVHMAWDRPGIERLTVNTNTLDHPRALPLYQKAGFVPVRRASETRVLTRDRDMIDA